MWCGVMERVGLGDKSGGVSIKVYLFYTGKRT